MKVLENSTLRTAFFVYIDSRFIDIELVTNNATGLKIPVTSVVNKEFYTIPDEYATKGRRQPEYRFLKLVTDKGQ